MSDQISAVADSLSLHIFMSVKKREAWAACVWGTLSGSDGREPCSLEQARLIARMLQAQDSLGPAMAKG